jgi:predicted nucleotidyltransferase
LIPSRIREEKLAYAHQVAAPFVEDPAVRAVYVSGSLLAGLGSSTSDVDLFVVTDAPRDAGGDPSQFLSGDRRVDVEFRTAARIEALVEALGAYRVTHDDSSQHRLGKAVLDDAVRLKLGTDLKADPVLAWARERIGWDTLRRVLIGTHLDAARGFQEDALGALADAETGTAVLASHEMLIGGFQAFLAGCGELYVGSKWTWQKLVRAADRAPLPMPLFERMLLSPPLDLAVDGAAFVASRIRLCQALAVAAVTRGWEGPDAATWTAWGVGDAEVHRDLAWSAFRYGDELLIENGQDFSVRLSPQGMDLFGRCDGRPRRAVVAAMAAVVGQEHVDVVQRYLDRLLELGAVRVEPVAGAAPSGGNVAVDVHRRP